MKFEILFSEKWPKYWKVIPIEYQKNILNKMLLLKEERTFRHLKFGLTHFVLEIGQYRIIFSEQNSTRIMLFVGNNKDYERWLGLR